MGGVSENWSSANSRFSVGTSTTTTTPTIFRLICLSHVSFLYFFHLFCRECHQYLEDRPWADVLKFYSLLSAGKVSLQDLNFDGQFQVSVFFGCFLSLSYVFDPENYMFCFAINSTV